MAEKMLATRSSVALIRGLIMRRSLPTLVTVLLFIGACSNGDTPTSPTPAVSNPTTFQFSSVSGSRVGQGESPTYTVENATFQVGTDSYFVSVGVVPLGETAPRYTFVLAPPSGGQRIATGTYPLGKRGQTPGYGFEFSGRGTSCLTGNGTVTIEEFQYAGLVEKLRFTFSVECDSTPAVTGRIVLNWVAGSGYR